MGQKNKINQHDILIGRVLYLPIEKGLS